MVNPPVLLSGFLLSLCAAGAAAVIAPFIGLSATLFALVFGLGLSFLYKRGSLKPGIDWSARAVLRVGIVLLGFRIALEDLLALGWPVLGMIALMITAAITAGLLLAKLLNMHPGFGLLSGGAAGICGASAAMAIASVLPPDDKQKSRDLSLVIVVVTAFSTLEMALLPALAQWWGLSAQDTALFLGAIVHDVAQSAGAGYSVSPEVGDQAVLTKMVRVVFIVPVELVVAFVFAVQSSSRAVAHASKAMPLFLLLFFAAIAMNSVVTLPAIVTNAMAMLSQAALLTAIAAIGLKTNIAEIARAGWRPVVVIALEIALMIAVVLAFINFL